MTFQDTHAVVRYLKFPLLKWSGWEMSCTHIRQCMMIGLGNPLALECALCKSGLFFKAHYVWFFKNIHRILWFAENLPTDWLLKYRFFEKLIKAIFVSFKKILAFKQYNFHLLPELSENQSSGVFRESSCKMIFAKIRN